MSLLDGLIWIQRNSDPTLAFRCACRVGMCGTCGVVVNGREGLACRTMARDLLDGGARVEPMRHMPVVRDLVTDGSAFYAKLRQVSPRAPDPSDGARLAVIDPNTPERAAVELQRECIYWRPVLLGLHGGGPRRGLSRSCGAQSRLSHDPRRPERVRGRDARRGG